MPAEAAVVQPRCDEGWKVEASLLSGGLLGGGLFDCPERRLMIPPRSMPGGSPTVIQYPMAMRYIMGVGCSLCSGMLADVLLRIELELLVEGSCWL